MAPAAALVSLAALCLVPTASASSASSAPTGRTVVPASRTTTVPARATVAVTRATSVLGSRAAAAHPPSGVALARTAPRGWVRVWADDFGGTSLKPAWDKYSGYPGSYSTGYWSPRHVQVGRGMMTLRGCREGSTFVTAGVSATRVTSQVYGKYLVRMRADVGQGVGYVALLWPSDGWPPEVDFAEDAGHQRTTTSATAHWGRANLQQQLILNADFSKWHTLGVEWTPTSLKYTIDGRVWATMTGSAVPHQPMHLAVQSAALACSSWAACVTSQTPRNVNVEVDWVDVYRMA